jgi:amidase
MTDDDSGRIDRRAFFRGLAAAGAAGALLALARCAPERTGAAPHDGATDQADAAHPHETHAAVIALGTAAREIASRDLSASAADLAAGRTTSRALLAAYAERIEALDRAGPVVGAVIETAADATGAADALDTERARGDARGPLHGLPLLIKDNIATHDGLATTAGSLALLGARPPREAHAVARLRAAGALIFGKTNLSEWANFRSIHSTSGWSARGGQTRNPHALDRSPGGSSSGSGAAVAAGLCAAAVGSETDGSIVCPAAVTGIVGLKPTVGLVSRRGVIPISHSQDTLGPMARTVRDACMLLSAMAGVDPEDPATAEAEGRVLADYAAVLDRDVLRGARIGVARDFFGHSPRVDACVASALATLRDAGAELVDIAGIDPPGAIHRAELHVLLCEFKAGIAEYLAELSGEVLVRSLPELIAWNDAHHDREMPHFGQELLRAAEASGGLSDPGYATARALCVEFGRTHATGVLDRERLDAWVAPTGGPAWRIDYTRGDALGPSCASGPAMAGAPHVTVPCGHIEGLPIGLSFVGRRFDEATVLRLAYAFEERTQARIAPSFRESIRRG